MAGAGQVGIELLGELVAVFPNGTKKLGLCLRGNRLLPSMPDKVHRIAENFFRERGVEIFYNTPYND